MIKENPYEYRVESAPHEELTTLNVQTIADELHEGGWEFICFEMGKMIMRRKRGIL